MRGLVRKTILAAAIAGSGIFLAGHAQPEPQLLHPAAVIFLDLMPRRADLRPAGWVPIAAASPGRPGDRWQQAG